MKKPIPTPLIAAVGVVALVVLAFLFIRLNSGPGEFPTPKNAPNYQEGIPDYIKNHGKGPIPGAPPPGTIPKGPPPGSTPAGNP